MLALKQINKKKLEKHEDALRKSIFFTNTKWPHFNILFKSIKNLSKKLKKNSLVVFLERTNLYGNISLFAPFFYNHKVLSVDCITTAIKKRGKYNNKLALQKNILKIKSNYQSLYSKINLENQSADCIIIPNLLHHVPLPELLFNEVDRIIKKNGIVVIFEPLIRELHQVPEDYIHFTPYALKNIFKKKKYKNFEINYDGGPFTATIYCFEQALQYLPKDERRIKIKEFEKLTEIFLKYEKKYKRNLDRKFTKFPVSYVFKAIKK